MNPTDKTARSQTDSISFEFDPPHSPQNVWRALTDPVLLAEWLLPVVGLKLEPGATFTFQAPPQPGWDGIVKCRLIEIEAQKKLSYAWVVGDTPVVGYSVPARGGVALLFWNGMARPSVILR
ncbi:MAG: SRPBCC domain-containing protein [Phycisphaerales bacterium]|nr:MAG: SRPBCC domain-containing protein [Phycisphaerales bacterium]